VSLEQDAQQFSEKALNNFLKDLNRVTKPVEVYIKNCLYDTKEREKTLVYLEEMKLWARYCAEEHKLK